jgi:oligopeptide/dipeptide ABC transporter ATP-binding protein
MRQDSLLSIHNLRTRFHTYEGVLTAVDGIGLEVYRGETLGVVGESGCGKSVTALSILRLLASPPAEIQGEILFDGKNLLSMSLDEIRQIRGNSISMIFQEPMTSLNPVLTIGEQISEGIKLHQGVTHQEAWSKAVEMLRIVQIPSPEIRAKEYPHKLSGGMRQRAMIAMALSCHPRLLLADEPTTALDVTIQAQIVELMERLKEEIRTSIVLITHNLGLIAEMAKRVVVMYMGKVVEEALVEDLFLEPLHPYTHGLLESIPWMGRKMKSGRKQLQEIPGMVPSLLEIPKGCRFHPRCSRVMDICRKEEPILIRPKEGRQVLCWLWA